MMIHMTEGKKNGRSYSEEFRAEAVQLLGESGKSMRQVASDIGVDVSSLRSWAKRAKADTGMGNPGVANSSELEELRALRKENRELRMERDFLKKLRSISRAKRNEIRGHQTAVDRVRHFMDM